VRVSRRIGLLLAVPAGIVLVLVLTHSLWLSWLGAYLIQSDAPFPAEIIVVIGGGRTGNRILKAAALAQEGYAPRVLVSGVDDIYGLHESDLEVMFAVRHGYDERLFQKLRVNPDSTAEEARDVAAELHRLGIRKYILVTSDYHTRRAGKMFRKATPDMEVRVVSAPDPLFHVRDWWRDRQTQKVVLLEWSKTVAAVLGI